MKNKILTALILTSLLFSTMSLFAQSNFETAFLNNFYVGFGFDPRMAIEGPNYSYTDKESTLHWHLEAGWDFDFNDDYGLRIGVGYSEHHEINYKKITIPKVDFIVRDLFGIDGVDQYTGIELSTIYRTGIPYKVNGGVGETGRVYYHNPDSYSAGVNIEYKYNFTDKFSIGAKYSYFIAEGVLIKEGKFMRDEGTITAYYKFR